MRRGLAFLLAPVLTLAAPLSAQPAKDAPFGVAGIPNPEDAPLRATKVPDQAVEKAIQKGIEFLWAKQFNDGCWPAYDFPEGGTYPVGPTALVAYALLESGVKPQDPRMVKALNWLERHDSQMTYCLAFRASAFASAARKNKNYLKPLAKDVERLYQATMPDGGHTYYATERAMTDKERAALFQIIGGISDPSNSQYALLAAWAGSNVGVEVPRRYWDLAMNYWVKMQSRDGGWGYQPRLRAESYGSMTVAGLASLYVCMDNLYAARYADCGVVADVPAIKRGLDWLEKDFPTTLQRNRHFLYYYLFGIERVALASGYKYFGKTDWYQMGAQALLDKQANDGSWISPSWGCGSDITATSYAVLFLIRGREAVIFNKLQSRGDWNNRPRDLATLTRWLSYTLESPVHWQIIGLDIPVSEWHDAPILYLGGCKAPSFTDEEIDKLRQFVFQGGVIFSCTEGAGAGFRDGIRKVYQKMLPKLELTPLPADHPIYSIQYKLYGKPKFHMITNGIRPLVIHTDEDMPRCWQLNQNATARWAFEAGANIYIYVTAKTPLRYRGTSFWVEQPPAPAGPVVKLVRLKYAGDYDPEPLAYTRFARLMSRDVGVQVEPTEPMDIAQLPDGSARIAVLTGTTSFKLTDEEKEALKKYVRAGGMLVMDAAGGSKSFLESAQQLLIGMFGLEAVKVAGEDSPIHRLKGMEIQKVKFTPAARQRLGEKPHSEFSVVKVGERIGVVLSPEDITGALLGPPSIMNCGYEGETAFQLMRNLVLLATGVTPPAGNPDSTGASPQPNASPQREP